MGVGSQVQSFGRPHPLYMTHGRGSRLYDVDGNEFIDYLLNYGPLILGHCPKGLHDAVREQLERGTGFGEPHPLQIEVSRLLVEAVPCFEVVNFNNTGSEAVQAVLRLARAVTGRTKFIKFEGHYHGWMDNVFFSFHPDKDEDFGTRETPKPVIHGYSKGVARNVLDNVIVLPWNNLDYVKNTFQNHKNEIAAILNTAPDSHSREGGWHTSPRALLEPYKSPAWQTPRQHAADANVLRVIDQALANEHLRVPNRTDNPHGYLLRKTYDDGLDGVPLLVRTLESE